MRLTPAIRVTPADGNREISVTGTEDEQDRARDDQQRSQVERPRESGQVSGEESPSRVGVFAGAIGCPENDASKEQGDGVDLGLSRIHPHRRHESGGDTGCRSRETITRPFREKTGENAAPERGANGG